MNNLFFKEKKLKVLINITNGVNLKKLSQELKINNSNVTKITNYFEDIGLITRVTNKKDKRKIYLYFTPKGIEVKNKFIELMELLK